MLNNVNIELNVGFRIVQRGEKTEHSKKFAFFNIHTREHFFLVTITQVCFWYILSRGKGNDFFFQHP